MYRYLLFFFAASAQAAPTVVPPNTCRDKPAEVAAWFREWRDAKRLEFARNVAKGMPALLRTQEVGPHVPPGASCVKGEAAIVAKKADDGDYFIVGCLMQTRGVLTHFMRIELLVETGDCISNAAIDKMVASAECRNQPYYPTLFLRSQVETPFCTIGSLPPRFRNPPKAELIDISFLHQFPRSRLRGIVDEKTLRVKGAAVGGTECGNPLGCLPPASSGTSEAR